MSITDVEFPKTLFVKEEHLMYPYHDLKHLVGRSDLAASVPDNDGTTVVATYALVQVETYKKIVTKTETVKKV